MIKYVVKTDQYKEFISTLLVFIFYLLVRNSVQACYFNLSVYALMYFFSMLIIFLGASAIDTVSEKKNYKYLITGLALGLACLFTSVFKYIILIIILINIFVFTEKKINYKKYMVSMLLLVFGFGIIVTPWLVRNYVISGKFDFANRIGYMMYGKAMAASKGYNFRAPDDLLHQELRKLAYDRSFNITDTQLDDYFMKKAKPLIKKYYPRIILDCIYQLKHQLAYKKREIYINLIILTAFIISIVKRNYIQIYLFLIYGYFIAVTSMTTSFLPGHSANILYIKFICFTVGCYMIIITMFNLRKLKI